MRFNNAGVHFRIIRIISSWLDERRANVIVGGEQSDDIFLSDMVYQGTVLGPILWKLLFGDASRAIQMLKFSESVFADDLHACRNYDVKFQIVQYWQRQKSARSDCTNGAGRMRWSSNHQRSRSRFCQGLPPMVIISRALECFSIQDCLWTMQFTKFMTLQCGSCELYNGQLDSSPQSRWSICISPRWAPTSSQKRRRYIMLRKYC